MAKRLAKTRQDISNFLPKEEVCLAEEDEIYCYAILGDSNENTIYSDLTGRFPVESFDEKKLHFCCVCLQTKYYLYVTNEIPRRRKHASSIPGSI